MIIDIYTEKHHVNANGLGCEKAIDMLNLLLTGEEPVEFLDRKGRLTSIRPPVKIVTLTGETFEEAAYLRKASARQ